MDMLKIRTALVTADFSYRSPPPKRWPLRSAFSFTDAKNNAR